MKKYYFYLYIVAVLIVLGFFGVYKYHKYVANKNRTLNSQDSAINLNATDKLISKYEQQLQSSPGDERISLELANGYIQKARESGDASYYSKVDTLMDTVQAKDPNNSSIYTIRGSVALSRHHFVDALALGQKGVLLNPNAAVNYGIVADAQTELGQNEEAINTLQKMVDKRPDYSSFSRIAYARELHGDIDGARKAIETAVEEGSSFQENVAWGYVEIGKLDMRTNLAKAAEQFNLAISLVPRYTPGIEQLGKIAFANKDYQGALEKFQNAFDILPLAQYSVDQGEVYLKMGDTEKALQQFELARLAFEKSQSVGVNTDMEYSLFLSEHDLDLTKALDLAIQSYKVRPSIYGADTLAWAYYKNNQPQQAQKYINEALRLGLNDPAIVFHAGMIAEQNHNMPDAKMYYQKTVALNPHFSILYAGVAESKLN